MTTLKEQARQLIITQLVPLFETHGVKLNHHQDTENTTECWEKTLDNDVEINIYASVNGHNLPGIFGTCTLSNGEEFSLTCCAEDWIEMFGDDVNNMINDKPLF